MVHAHDLIHCWKRTAFTVIQLTRRIAATERNALKN